MSIVLGGFELTRDLPHIGSRLTLTSNSVGEAGSRTALEPASNMLCSRGLQSDERSLEVDLVLLRLELSATVSARRPFSFSRM